MFGFFKSKAPKPAIDTSTYGQRTAAETFANPDYVVSPNGLLVLLTRDELSKLLQDAHTRGMADMVDMVENATRNLR